MRMKKGLLVIVMLLAASSSGARDTKQPLDIGGYYLGMTNAQAAKIGLRDCKQKYSYSDIECVPILPALPGETESRIIFDDKTRKVTDMYVLVSKEVGTKASANSEVITPPPWSAQRWWQEVDALTNMVLAELRVRCTSRYKDIERTPHVMTEECHKDQITRRIRRGYNDVFEFSSGRHRGNNPHFQVKITLESGGEIRYRIRQESAARELKAKSKMSNFAAGK